MNYQNLLDSLPDTEALAIAAAFPASKGDSSRSTNRLLQQNTASTTGDNPEESEGENNLLDGLRQLSGLMAGDAHLISSLLAKPREVKDKEVLEDPSLLGEYLTWKAYSAAEKNAPQFIEDQLKKLTQDWFLKVTGDGVASDALDGGMSRMPGADILGDPLGWINERWTDLEKGAQKKIDEFTEWENLATLGVDKALDFAEDKLMSALGLDELGDKDSAVAHISAEILGNYLMSEIKGYLKTQLLSLLKDQFPISLADLKEQKALLDRLKEAAGIESDAGCVPIALRYDIGSHGGSITSPCATTVVAGGAEIAVARQGDGFECSVHLVSNPIKEGMATILVEGLPITAHKLHTTCDAMIVGSAGHNVFVADCYPMVVLPPNEAPACSAPPPSQPPPAADSPNAVSADAKPKPKPTKDKPKNEASESKSEDAEAPGKPEPELSAEQRDELQQRMNELYASVGNSKEKYDEWSKAKQELAAIQEKLKDEESYLQQGLSAKRKANEDLMLELLSRAPGGNQLPKVPSSMEEVILDMYKTPADRMNDYEETLKAPGRWEEYVDGQQKVVNDMKQEAARAQDRENQAAIDFSDAVKDTAHTTGQIILTPLDVPIPRIRIGTPRH